MSSGSNSSKRSDERSLARSLGALFAVTGSLILSSPSTARPRVPILVPPKRTERSRWRFECKKFRSNSVKALGRKFSKANLPRLTFSLCGGGTGTTGILDGDGTTGILGGVMAVGGTVAGAMAVGIIGTTGITGATGRELLRSLGCRPAFHSMPGSS